MNPSTANGHPADERCAATTQAGTRCRNRIYENGYCYVHRTQAAAPERAIRVSVSSPGQSRDLARPAPPPSHEPPQPEIIIKAPIDDADNEETPENALRARLEAEVLAMGERLLDLAPAGVQGLVSLAARLADRLRGNYAVDDFGYDPEFMAAVQPLFDFLYREWWRVTLTGVENVPHRGGGLLVANHSGVLPWDGAMMLTGLQHEMQPPRLMRALVANWFPTLPFLSVLLTKMGQVQASQENSRRLLEAGELVAVFPEGYKGVGKLYRDRYHLARFGRGGFVRVALRTGAPIIPVAVTGAEETYPMLANVDWLARLLGFPYFPITPTWPWLGLLGVIPLPSKWYIDIGEPIVFPHTGDAAAANPALVARLTDQVRTTIQSMLYARLRKRPSVFLE